MSGIGQFGDRISPESIGFSHRDFRFVVQPFDDAAGNDLPRPEVVQDEVAVGPQHTDDRLNRKPVPA